MASRGGFRARSRSAAQRISFLGETDDHRGGRLTAYPQDLAHAVCERWHSLLKREPSKLRSEACPPEALLRELLEVAQIVAGVPQEGRYPRVNLAAVPLIGDGKEEHDGYVSRFQEARRLSVEELRGIAPAIDANTSAVWMEWSKTTWRIAGLVDFGPD